MADCYKIKLRNAGYRLVYQVVGSEATRAGNITWPPSLYTP